MVSGVAHDPDTGSAKPIFTVEPYRVFAARSAPVRQPRHATILAYVPPSEA